MPEVNATSRMQRIIVDPASYAVSIVYAGHPGPPGPTGPTGPQGPEGPPGGGVASVVGTGIIHVDTTDPKNIVISTVAGSTPGPLTVSGTITATSEINTSAQFTYMGSAQGLRMSGDAAYIAWFDGSLTLRRGYLQGNSNGMTLASEAGPLNLASSSGYATFPYSSRIGAVTAHGASWGGLSWSNGQYLIMSEGNTTLVSSPGTGAVELRCGVNGGYFFQINSNGWHSIVGHLNHNGYDIQSVASISCTNVYGSNLIQAPYLRKSGGAGYIATTDYDTDSGLYSWGDGTIGLVVNGLDVLYGWADAVKFRQLMTYDGYRITSNGGAHGYWAERSFVAQVMSGGSRAGIACHPGGVAKQWDCATNDGGFFAHNEDGGWYADIWCNTVSQASSIRGKEAVEEWPPRIGTTKMSVGHLMSQINVVSYRIKPEMALIQAETMGIHDCEAPQETPCGGTHENPCNRVRDQRNPHIGIIIEDLVDILPEAVAYDLDGKPGAMRTGTMIGFILALCKEQQERIEALEGVNRAA